MCLERVCTRHDDSKGPGNEQGPRGPMTAVHLTRRHMAPCRFPVHHKPKIHHFSSQCASSTQNDKRSALCHCGRWCVSCPCPQRAIVVILTFVRPNKTAFTSGNWISKKNVWRLRVRGTPTTTREPPTAAAPAGCFGRSGCCGVLVWVDPHPRRVVTQIMRVVTQIIKTKKMPLEAEN